MIVNFRQGLVNSPRNPSGQPDFLQIQLNSVNVVATNSPVVLTVAHGQSDYLITIESNVSPAWRNFGTTEFPSGINYWLYLDVNAVTGEITYGQTKLEPVSRMYAPLNPQRDQHWFDTANNRTKVWIGSSWQDKIRIFVGQLTATSTIVHNPFGSHVGITGERKSGKIAFDVYGKPFRKSNGELFTTEDDIFVDGIVASPNSLETRLITVQAAESIPRFSVVKFTAFDTVRLARYEDTDNKILAFALQSVATNQPSSVVLQGVIENPAWNWPAVNLPLWVDEFGQLTTNDPMIANPARGKQLPVGRVLAPQKIRFIPPVYSIAVDITGDGTGIPGPIGPDGEQGAPGASAYEIAVANGFIGTEVQWLMSLIGETGPEGAPGEQGVPGISAYDLAVANGFVGTEAQWLASLIGPTGTNGIDGVDGDSGYQVAVANGFVGTEVDWLASLVGPPGPAGNDGAPGVDGLSAYEVAVANGFVGTESQWLASLVGEQGEIGPEGPPGSSGPSGSDGLSAYEVAVAYGFIGTESQWLASLVGPAGADGTDGLSAYEVAVANGFVGTESQWLASLVGEQGEQGPMGPEGPMGTGLTILGTLSNETELPIAGTAGDGYVINGELFVWDGTQWTNVGPIQGDSAYEVAVANGFVGTEAQWLASLIGPQGPQGPEGQPGADGQAGDSGDSAYEVAVANGFVGTEAQWLASLVGPIGPSGVDGSDGLSAYEVAVANGFVGTESQWLASLVGPAGTNGVDGVNGTDGLPGADGQAGDSGDSAYEVAVANGFVGTESQWLASLVGEQGEQGPMGPEGPMGTGLTILGTFENTVQLPPAGNLGEGYVVAGDLYIWDGTQWTNIGPIQGDSAYEVAVANGFVGTEVEWLESLVGIQGNTGADGTDGQSAYQLAVANGFVGTESEWLDSLVGPIGPNGPQGPEGESAYEVAVANGFVGTESQWLESLVGPIGPQGPEGLPGADGTDGTNGVGVPTGGLTKEVLVKVSSTDYDTEWRQLDYADLLGTEYTKEPTGFIDRTSSMMAFNNGNRTFTIQPTSSSFTVYIKGKQFVKTVSENVVISNITGLYYIYYNELGVLSAQTSFFDLQTQVPVAYVYWNAAYSTAYYIGDERHGLTMDWATHQYLHETHGARYANGLSAIDYTTVGTGAINSDATLGITSGVIYDEDIRIQISHSATPTQPFQQILQNPAKIPVLHRIGPSGEWFKTTATDFPVKYGALVQYNENTGGTWSTPDATSGNFVAMFIIGTNNMSEPVMAVMGQRQDSTLAAAQTGATWESLSLQGLPSLEFRPLYRIIFETRTSYTNTPKARIREVYDLRKTELIIPAGGSTTISVQDEGSLLTTAVTDFNFTGTGVTATVSGSQVTVDIPGSTGGSIEVRDEGLTIAPTASSINFTGTGVTATSSGGAVTVNIPGSAGGGGGSIVTRLITISPTARVLLSAFGTQAELDAAIAAVSQTSVVNDTMTIGNVSPTLKLISFTFTYDANHTSATVVYIKYPEQTGAASTSEMMYPALVRGTFTGGVFGAAVTAQQLPTLAGGVVTVTSANNASNGAAYHRVTII
jgi:hypothetical protein